MKTSVFHYHGEALPYPVYEDMTKLNDTVKAIADMLEIKFKDKELGLLCRGSSGMCIATALSRYNREWHIIYVRKNAESPHCCSSDMHVDRGSHNAGQDNWTIIFVDDLIASGTTLVECAKAVSVHDKKIHAVVLTNSCDCEFNSEAKKLFKAEHIELPKVLITRL